MYFIAEELREILASLGLETVEDLVGRTDLLQRSSQLRPGSKAQFKLKTLSSSLKD